MSNRLSHQVFALTTRTASSRERKERTHKQHGHRAGIAFTTTDRSLSLYIYSTAATAQPTRYFVACTNRPSAQRDHRLPLGKVFAQTDRDSTEVGLAFLGNSDDSYSIVVGVRGDPLPRTYVLEPL